MRYEKDAVKHGKQNLIWGGLFLFILFGIHAAVYYQSKDNFTTSLIVLSLVWGLVCGVFIFSGIELIKSGGKWLITIDQSGVNWRTPIPSKDKSFHFALEEIDHIETRIRKSRKGRTRRTHSIILRNGGVSLAQVLIEIERLGIGNKIID